MPNTNAIVLRKWDSTPDNQSLFSIVTKFTDLGTPDTSKIIYGYYINASIDPQISKAFSLNAKNTHMYDAQYEFDIYARGNPIETFKHVDTIKNSWSKGAVGTSEYHQAYHNSGLIYNNNVMFSMPLKTVRYFSDLSHTSNMFLKSVQIKIESKITGKGFGINDFGLIYRVLRSTGVETHDES